ncbi:hypothetical protein CD790_07660 [Streptomyces sp. SAJ15]|nr:hypothetical protein CD790_07660 [Streptomyces sp. SAJ15]
MCGCAAPSGPTAGPRPAPGPPAPVPRERPAPPGAGTAPPVRRSPRSPPRGSDPGPEPAPGAGTVCDSRHRCRRCKRSD